MRTKLLPTIDPIDALVASDTPGVLAVIAGVDGPSYRPLGACMAVFSTSDLVGTLSSGCIEADIALQSVDALADGQPRLLRYGRGSPFVDIELPCGGGLDIYLIPAPDFSVLEVLSSRRRARQPCTLKIDLGSGAIEVAAPAPTARDGTALSILFEPEIQFLIFGKGPEASTFAGLVQSAGYPNLVLSPDEETLQIAAQSGSSVRHLVAKSIPGDISPDARTAIALFFHDHDWEPPLLKSALQTPAFYIGAQGSQRARDTRLAALNEMGVSAAEQARLHGPVGLIPSARDAGTLAVSVLAEILAVAMTRPT